MSYTKSFEANFWNIKSAVEIVKTSEGVKIAEEIPKDTLRMKSDGSGFVQVMDGKMVAELSKNDVVLIF